VSLQIFSEKGVFLEQSQELAMATTFIFTIPQEAVLQDGAGFPVGRYQKRRGISKTEL
jgi:hypothetical protein